MPLLLVFIKNPFEIKNPTRGGTKKDGKKPSIELVILYHKSHKKAICY